MQHQQMSSMSLIIPGPSNLFLNGDDVSEDIRKWTVNDVYNFINSIPTCSEYAQVSSIMVLCLFLCHGCVIVSIAINNFTLQTFKDHMIDGETLPLLSEEHLLDTLGLKLGPALKIRSQVEDRFIHGPKYHPLFEQHIIVHLIKCFNGSQLSSTGVQTPGQHVLYDEPAALSCHFAGRSREARGQVTRDWLPC